jgi:hypothetical protein
MKSSVIKTVLVVLSGISLMAGCFLLFKYVPFHIDGDKLSMCVMFEAIIAIFTVVCAGYVYDESNKKGKR